MATSITVEQYIDQFDGDVKVRLEVLRNLIIRVVQYRFEQTDK